ncbi:MAG: B12-binding domain-containing radical SAM protein [Candidatus Anammoxibacter sp.]
MKILLIHPRDLIQQGPYQHASIVRATLYLPSFFAKGYFGLPLALPTLAALTPPQHTVKIIDEVVERINFDEKCDLVGITAMTLKAPRAYEIALEFKKRGVPVVMGGIHASMCSEEASKYVDCVVSGEAEELWPKVLEDFEQGKMQSYYKAEKHSDMSKIPPPRHDLTPYKKYFAFFLQTTRGCPFACKFCTVTKFNGRKLRRKSPSQVIKEIESVLKLRSTPLYIIDKDNANKQTKFTISLFFVDDNFAINRQHALDICAALKKFQDEKNIFINWFTQTSYEVGFDDELLDAMKSSGCRNLFIGFESLNPDALNAMNKSRNASVNYGALIKNIKRHGLEIYFSTIVGGDFDNIETFKELANFVEENNIFYFFPNILTPYPGTELRHEMENSKNILIFDHEYYNVRNAVFKTKLMSPFELQKAYTDLCTRLFNFDKLLERGMKSLKYPQRYYLVPWIRPFVCLLFSAGAMLFLFQRKITTKTFLKLLLAAPRLIIRDGSLLALDIFACSIEYSLFARNEAQYLSKSPAASLPDSI